MSKGLAWAIALNYYSEVVLIVPIKPGSVVSKTDQLPGQWRSERQSFTNREQSLVTTATDRGVDLFC
jgi:hypothetical protein